MLYWAEGSKSGNMMQFANTDPNMMKFFVEFVEDNGVNKEDMTASVNCYLNNGLTLKQVEDFWLGTLGLPR